MHKQDNPTQRHEYQTVSPATTLQGNLNIMLVKHLRMAVSDSLHSYVFVHTKSLFLSVSSAQVRNTIMIGNIQRVEETTDVTLVTSMQPVISLIASHCHIMTELYRSPCN